MMHWLFPIPNRKLFAQKDELLLNFSSFSCGGDELSDTVLAVEQKHSRLAISFREASPPLDKGNEVESPGLYFLSEM